MQWTLYPVTAATGVVELKALKTELWTVQRSARDTGSDAPLTDTSTMSGVVSKSLKEKWKSVSAVMGQLVYVHTLTHLQ